MIVYYSVEPVMTSTDQTGCSDEFNSSFGSTNSSEFASSPKAKSPEGSTISLESEPSDQIIMDVPFATIATSPQPSTSRAGQSFSRGKDLTLLLKPGDKYQTPQELLYFIKNMALSKTTPRRERKTFKGTQEMVGHQELDESRREKPTSPWWNQEAP